MINRSFVVGVTVIAALGLGELVARRLGLGTPPLSITHPTIEYLFKPDQDVYPFHNHVHINAYGMRSRNFPIRKSRSDEYRVLVFGDSVINGGNQTDDKALATSILEARLPKFLNRPVLVANISAGSWGPPNMLAYVKEFGFFDADVIVVVLSSHDYGDVPTFSPLNPTTHPIESPRLALGEGITRYLPRYLPWSPKLTGIPYVPPPSLEDTQAAMAALKTFLRLANTNVNNVQVFLHWTKSEVATGSAEIGNTRIFELCREESIEAHQLGPIYLMALKSGTNPYRDDIHPNEIGQRVLAEALLKQLDQTRR